MARSSPRATPRVPDPRLVSEGVVDAGEHRRALLRPLHPVPDCATYVGLSAPPRDASPLVPEVDAGVPPPPPSRLARGFAVLLPRPRLLLAVWAVPLAARRCS